MSKAGVTAALVIGAICFPCIYFISFSDRYSMGIDFHSSICLSIVEFGAAIPVAGAPLITSFFIASTISK